MKKWISTSLEVMLQKVWVKLNQSLALLSHSLVMLRLKNCQIFQLHSPVQDFKKLLRACERKCHIEYFFFLAKFATLTENHREIIFFKKMFALLKSILVNYICR